GGFFLPARRSALTRRDAIEYNRHRDCGSHEGVRMGRSARLSFVLALAWLCLTSAAQAGPLLSTGPYDMTLPSGGMYEVSAEVSLGGAGYVYSYSVTNLTQAQRYFELGIAESPDLIGLYSEKNPLVPGGQLLRDKTPFFSNVPDPHNYVFTH